MRGSFSEAQEAVFAAYGAGDYPAALRLARAARRDHPARAARADYWIACLLCRSGQPEAALRTLQACLAEGLWPNPSRLRSDPDLEPLRDRPELEAVIAECERRRDRQQHAVEADLRVLAPAGGALPPLLLALHMRGGDAEETLAHWRAATGLGTLLAAPQGTVLEGPHEYAWDEDAVEGEVAAHLASLRREHRHAPERLVLGGASQGARLAVALAVRGAPEASRGFIAVVGAPALDGTLAEAVGGAVARGVRGVFITGETDIARANVESAHGVLRDAGMAVRLEVVPGLGHAFPRDFPARLRSALAFVLA